MNSQYETTSLHELLVMMALIISPHKVQDFSIHPQLTEHNPLPPGERGTYNLSMSLFIEKDMMQTHQLSCSNI